MSKADKMIKFAAFFGLLILPLSILAQNADCERMMRQAEVLSKKKEFQKAINKYTAAATCNPQLQQRVNAKINEVFILVEKEKESAIRNEKEANKQKARAEDQTKIAFEEKNKAIKLARQSKSKELAANALLESSKEKNRDETIALRLAYTALKIDTTKEAQSIFDKIIFRADNQFYLRKFKSSVDGFNKGLSRFWKYSINDDSTRLIDWLGNICGSVKGIISEFNNDSTKIWTYSYQDDSTRLCEWSITHRTVKGKMCYYNFDSSRIYIYIKSLDSTRLIDSLGYIHNSVKGEFKGFSDNYSRFWTYSNQEDSSRLFDWRGNEYGSVKGIIISFNYNSSRFLSYITAIDSTKLTDWSGKVFKNYENYVNAFNYDSTRSLVTYHRGTLLNDHSHIERILNGYLQGFNHDSTRFWGYDFESDSTYLIGWSGNTFGSVKGKIICFNRDSTCFWSYSEDEDSTRFRNWDGKIYSTVKGKISGFNGDSSCILVIKNGQTCLIDWLSRAFEKYSINLERQSDWIYSPHHVNDWFTITYSKFKDEISRFNNNFIGFWILDQDDNTLLYDWKGKIYSKIKGKISGFNPNFTRFWTYSSRDDSTFICDWTGKIYSKIHGDITGFNPNFTRFWTYSDKRYSWEGNTQLNDWTGKIYGIFDGAIDGFNKDTSLFYISRDNYTVFYNWNGALTNVYRGEVFGFESDNQHVMMRIPYDKNDGYILEMHCLYKSIHDFMKSEVADFTPEERIQYGVDDWIFK